MKRGSRQRGAALLTAMVIVTLVASLAAAMVWRQVRAVSIEAADRARAQAGWVLLGGLDWARLILREDARNNQREPIDHLGEPWAVPLAEARLSTFLAADRGQAQAGDDAALEAFLSGSIEDAQARYNLLNVALAKDEAELALEQRVVERLLEGAGLSRALAQRVVEQIRAASRNNQDVQDAPLLARQLDQLAWYGLDADARSKLEPWLILLPSGGSPTRLNLNTAPREVLAAALDGMNLALAERMVQTRKLRPFRSLDDAKSLLPEPLHAALSPTRFDVKSEHFIVTGRLRLDERVMQQRSLLKREGLEVKLLRRERVSSLDEASTQARPPLLAP
ncbi:MAG: type II secretion system minor pseudopilin GspK [Burkholderiales bacterium]|nr:type II secretion system minor pseudopilin GspK [Burkholderiales bacterium]